jgi:signal transduction histidine kinase
MADEGHVNRAWRIFVAVAALGLVGYVVLPMGDLVSSLYYDAFALAAVGAIGAGVALHRPRVGRPWLLIAAGQLLWIAGDVVYTVHAVAGTSTPFPSIADALYLAGYPVIGAGLVLLVRAREPVGNRAALVDASIVAIAAGVLFWVLIASPYARDSSLDLAGRLVATAYPAADGLLLVVAARLLLGSGAGRTSFRLLMAGLLVLLVADAAYGVLELQGLYAEQDFIDVWWLVSYGAIGAAALHPSMRSIADPLELEVRPISPWRLVLLAAATLVAPVLLVIEAAARDPVDGTVVAGCSAALFLLVVLRMHGLLRQVGRAVEVERRALEEMKAVDDMKTAFLHAVSHELRTPLTAILGSAVTLEHASDLDLSPTDHRSLATSLAANARKLDRLLTDLLDLDRLDRGAVEPRRSDVDVRELAARVVAQLDIPPEHPVSVDGPSVVAGVEAAQVERIVENLVLNAFRHTPPGTPVWVVVEPSGDGVLLRVDDAGPGVPDGQKEAIFGAFARGDGAAAHRPGVGIGLSLVFRFAAVHGGRAWVQDRPGGGASFRVWLPAGRSHVTGQDALGATAH